LSLSRLTRLLKVEVLATEALSVLSCIVLAAACCCCCSRAWVDAAISAPKVREVGSWFWATRELVCGVLSGMVGISHLETC
jgi:hypothetical protein